jgi:4,5-DOPA dioxygenase extradiol
MNDTTDARMPADNRFTRALGAIAADIPTPRSVLVVSAHWMADESRVLALERPRTIHDFGGFPRELYDVQYPAVGSPETARLVCDLAPEVTPDTGWGLDHGAWTVLRHMWPDANVPVLELSLDMTAPAETHWELGAKLAALRDQDVLVIGSGNIVHSFAGIEWGPDAKPKPWATEFDAWVADDVTRRDAEALTHWEDAGQMARLSVPTTDHYLPMLYPAAMADATDEITFPHESIDMGSMSMRCIRWG